MNKARILIAMLVSVSCFVGNCRAEDDRIYPSVIKLGEEAVVSYVFEIPDAWTYYVYAKGRISLGDRNTNGCEARVALYDKKGDLFCFYAARHEVIGVLCRVRPESNLSWGPGAAEYIPDVISWSWVKDDGNPSAMISDGYAEAQNGRLRSLRESELPISAAMSKGLPPPAKR